MRSWLLMAPLNGFFGTTLITAPVAPSPNSTEAGPRSTSTRSTDQVSTGKVTVPAPTYWRGPAYSCMVALCPGKPRGDSAVPPLPGLPMLLMPGVRVTASCTLRLLRPRTCAPLRLLVLAGVCKAVRPRREPLLLGVCRSLSPSAEAFACRVTAGRLTGDSPATAVPARHRARETES